MLRAITFNPALDVSGSVEKLVPNEKSYVDHELRTPGGNGINAGLIAKRLSCSVTLSGFLGGPNGEEIRELLDQEKITHHFISIKGRTRLNVTISNKKDHLQTRLSFSGPKISTHEKKQLESYLQQFKSKDLVLFGGSLPNSVSSKDVSRWIKQLQSKNIRVMVDMPGKHLREIIRAKPWFIKPNLTEFQELTEKRVMTIPAVIKEARKLLPYIPNICISSVEGGAVFLNQHECWFGKLPPVKIYSTVGAGDSMVGAMASMWLKKPQSSLKDLLNLGLASSYATLTEKGMNLGKKKDIYVAHSKIILREL